MKKRIREKLLGYALWFPFWLLMSGTMVFAEENINVVETYTGEMEISVYVKGADSSDDVTVQIGTFSCDSVSKKVLAEERLPMNTLVLLDNSASIPKKDRGTIAELLQNIISDRMENEKIAIAVLGREIEYLTDFTSDYTSLKSAIDKIEYQQSKTYLTDALYSWLSENHISRVEDCYQRIIVIADGTDNKSIGYTKDEL